MRSGDGTGSRVAGSGVPARRRGRGRPPTPWGFHPQTPDRGLRPLDPRRSAAADTSRSQDEHTTDWARGPSGGALLGVALDLAELVVEAQPAEALREVGVELALPAQPDETREAGRAGDAHDRARLDLDLVVAVHA